PQVRLVGASRIRSACARLLAQAIDVLAVKRPIELLDAAHAGVPRLHSITEAGSVFLHIRGGRERQVERCGFVARPLLVQRKLNGIVAGCVLSSGVVVPRLVSVDASELDLRAESLVNS